jgi:hypothetical protein
MTKLPHMLNASYRQKNNRFNRAGQVFTQSIEIRIASCIYLAIAQLRDILRGLISVGGLMETLYKLRAFVATVLSFAECVLSNRFDMTLRNM